MPVIYCVPSHRVNLCVYWTWFKNICFVIYSYKLTVDTNDVQYLTIEHGKLFTMSQLKHYIHSPNMCNALRKWSSQRSAPMADRNGQWGQTFTRTWPRFRDGISNLKHASEPNQLLKITDRTNGCSEENRKHVSQKELQAAGGGSIEAEMSSVKSGQHKTEKLTFSNYLLLYPVITFTVRDEKTGQRLVDRKKKMSCWQRKNLRNMCKTVRSTASNNWPYHRSLRTGCTTDF